MSRAQGLLIAGVTAGFVVAAVYVLRDTDGAVRGIADTTPAVGEDGKSLRERLLHGSPQELGVTPVRGVWGVLVERGFAKGVATIVGLADGTAGMYVSTGGAAAGGKAYPPARLAAVKLCEQAADSLAETIPADQFPAPTKGRVRFYVLTTKGVRTVETGAVLPPRDGEAPARGRDEALALVMSAGDALLDALKEGTARGVVH